MEKAKDIITLKGGQDDICTVTQAMCKFLNLKAGTMPAVAYKVPSDKVKYQDTWIDVIYGLISDTLLNTKTAENPQGRLVSSVGCIRRDTFRQPMGFAATACAGRRLFGAWLQLGEINR